MKNTIIINATNIGRTLDGLGIYGLDLLRELATMKTELRFIIYVNRSCAEHLVGLAFPKNCLVRWVSGAVSPDHRFKGHLLRLLFANYLALRHRGSVIFSTSQLEAMQFSSRQIVMIHDLIPLLFKKWHKKQYYYYKYYLGRVLRSARMVVTPSQHTKDLIVESYGGPADRIRVIHRYGVGVGEVLESATSCVEKEKFILYIGRIVQMKNVIGVLKAFAQIKDKVDHKLVIAGSGQESILKEFDTGSLSKFRLEPDRVELKGYIPDKEMQSLFSKASLLVFPSFYEGFGLPPLQAMAHGCPVVVSNTASLPEVCGDAAQYVDPADIHSIADGMYRVLTDNSLRQGLMERGFERAGLFSWEESAKLHLEVFEEAIAAPRYVAVKQQPSPIGAHALFRLGSGLQQ
jgi:glycosyltransferase involved in cell wall biosynthesis